MKLSQRLALCFAGALATLCLTAAADAEMVHFTAHLTTAAEVPPKSGNGSGDVQATLDTASDKLTYHVTYTGLSGEATMAHFHGPAAVGANAGVIVPIKGSVASPIDGEATLTPEQAADLTAGKWYFNVHTAANPGGEIRGQLEKQ